MTLSEHDKDKEFSLCSKNMDGYHKAILNLIKKKYFSKRANSDYVLLVVGERGHGKTTFAAQSCLYMNKDFNTKNIVYNHKTFFYNAWKDSPMSSIQLDEGILQVYKRKSMTQANKDVIETFNQIRAKQYFWTICIPKLKGVDSDFLDVCRGLVFINGQNPEKRFWYWYHKKQMLKMVAQLNKKKYEESVEFYQRSPKFKKGFLRDFLPFRKFFEQHKIVNVDLDTEKKYKKYCRLEKEKDEKLLPINHQRNETIYKLYTSGEFTPTQLAKYLGVTRQTIHNAVNQVKSQEKEV